MRNNDVDINSEYTEKSFYTKLKLIYSAILIAPSAFMLLIFVRVGETEVSFDDIDFTLFSVLIALIILGYFIGAKLYTDRILKIKSKLSLKEKLQDVMTASIIRFALLEGPALAGAIFFDVSHDLIFLLVGLIPLLGLLTIRPKKLKIRQLLCLAKEEEDVYLEK